MGAVVIAAIVALAVVRHRLLGAALPQTRGTIDVEGISAAVTVSRDRIGVPHIDAESMEDAAFAMGVAHAQDRLWQLEMSRRVAAGRVSEVVGRDGLEVDRFMRRLGLVRVCAAEERQSRSEVCEMLEAYAAGVNHVIRSGRTLPLEFRLLKFAPEPWLPLDSILVAKLLALGLSMNWDTELQRLEVLRALGPERAAKLDIVYPDANPTILEQTAAASSGASHEHLSAMFLEAARWIPTARGASNSWVVSAQRSSTGRPILCNDPHITPSIPSVWYAAHIRAGDDFESAGVTMPGIPFVLIGHNRRIAWGFTNSFADSQDLVIEEFNAAAAERYRTERGFERTRVSREIIHVKDASDEVEEVVVTRHGPIVDRVEDPARDVWRGLALQWTALTPGGAMEMLLQLQRASGWESFQRAFATLDAPSQNAVYADVDGHIGYLLVGRVPLRRRRASGLPVPGWNGDALWSGFIPAQRMPSLLDPPDGVIVTANNRIVGDDYPHYIASDYMNGYRALRIRELLDAQETVSPDDMLRMQMDIVSPPAREVASLLSKMTCGTGVAERARALLAVWDGSMEPGGIAPTLYEAFMARLAEHSLQPFAGDAWRTVAGTDRTHPVFGYPGNIAGRLTPSLLSRWEKGDTALLDGATWDDVVTQSLEGAWGDLRARYGRRTRRWRWGRVHALPLQHAFARSRPLGLIFNAGKIAVGGSIDTVMATSYLPADPFATRLFAPSWRQVIDVGDWAACSGVHMPGQSGQPGSRHYRDLRKRWLRNEQFPLLWDAAAVARGARRRLTLRPAELR